MNVFTLVFGDFVTAANAISYTNKVITTIVIRPLDDPTRRAQSVIADLQPRNLEYVGVGSGHIR